MRVDLNPGKIYSIMKREDGWLRLLLIDDVGRVVLDSANIPGGAGEAAGIPLPADRKDGYIIEQTLGDAGYIKGWKLVGTVVGRIDSFSQAA